MNFAVPQQQLVQSLTVISRIVSSRAILPVLTGVLLEAGDGQLRLVGSDNETWLELSIPATVAAAGSLVVPARYLTELVRRIPPEQVSVDADLSQRSISLSWSRGRLTVQGFDPAEFPLTPQVVPSAGFEIPRDQLRRMVRQTLFAASTDTTRIVFTGLLIAVEEGQLSLVATDGFRLAVTRGALPGKLDGELQSVLPGRVLGELAGLIEGDGPPVSVGIGKSLAAFETSSLRVVTRLVEGQFPPYRQVIPREFRTTLTIERQALEAACDLALAALRESGQAMRLDLAPDSLRIQANAPERGQLEGELPAALEGEPLRIAFNPRYLLEGIRVVSAASVVCRFTGPNGPACLEGEDGFLYVVLPVRLE
ncbi:MAG: DNA polymerase III subunit beta [bacterium]|nr:DNA polymerase III subunit beta [bacterium]